MEIQDDHLTFKGNIIIFNGTSSSGKTTLAHALQERLSDVYYRLSLDNFINMVDKEKLKNDWDNRIIEIYTTMSHTVRFFSDLGRNVVVDTVMLDGANGANILPECVHILEGYPVLFIKVECDLPELEKRERERGNRKIGMAKFQSEHMHGHNTYDLVINTSKNTVEKSIDEITSLLKQPQKWSAFQELLNILPHD